MLIFKLIGMQQIYCCWLTVIAIWLSIFVISMDCTCFTLEEVNEIVYSCQQIDMSDLHIYLNDLGYNRYNNAYDILRITHSSLTELDYPYNFNFQQLELNNDNISIIIPGFFRNFHQLRNLSLAHNNISEIIEGVFREMTELQEINLSHNQIKQLDIYTFVGLKQLTYIDLSFNKLKQLPENIFSYQSSITYLNIAHNNFTGIYVSNSKISKLTMNHNHIENIIETCDYKYLDVSYNNVTKINANAFKEASNLKELHLQHNSLSNIPSKVFANLVNLTYLDLSYNQFSLYQNGPNNDWLYIFSPLSLKKVLIHHNPWSCQVLRDIVTNLQSRKIYLGDYDAQVDNSNVLGMECYDNSYQTKIQVNDSQVSKIFDKIEYFQKKILQLTRDTQLNISDLNNDIIKLNDSILHIPEISNVSLDSSQNSIHASKNLMMISSLFDICKYNDHQNFTVCLTNLIKNIQESEISDINSKLKEISQQVSKLQEQDHQLEAAQSYNISLMGICKSSEYINLTECFIKLIENIQEADISDIKLQLNKLSKLVETLQDQGHRIVVTHSRDSPIFVIFSDIAFILILSWIIYVVYQVRKKADVVNTEQIRLV
ncbi:uncharacterized protein LOC143195716 isoform X1 [Rhynchophorus ferrugineus]|uniref:uncharacterized protein LOC143195716 isoform X1 n=1 Tax=Rhynchophorus ferrugineus TaxID=354439 RepID=UPI003FCEC154